MKLNYKIALPFTVLSLLFLSQLSVASEKEEIENKEEKSIEKENEEITHLIEGLPDEMTVSIFEYLDKEGLLNSRGVSKRFDDLVCSTFIKKEIQGKYLEDLEHLCTVTIKLRTAGAFGLRRISQKVLKAPTSFFKGLSEEDRKLFDLSKLKALAFLAISRKPLEDKDTTTRKEYAKAFLEAYEKAGSETQAKLTEQKAEIDKM